MRESGILMHITSLPGQYGVGTMGKQAYEFVDFLERAGQSYWQLLPLNPTGYGDSPYQSCSTFAGNHYLIDLNMLVEEGLLEQQELECIHWCDSDTKVSFGLLYENRLNVLRLAYSRFHDDDALSAFCAEHSGWLPDFALFMALKDKFGGAPWYRWEDGLKFRDTNTIWNARQELKREIRFYYFVQYLFFRQWTALRKYAHSKGVRIIGDVPIYVPYDSVDVWSSPELFQLNAQLDPVDVAGCPPDAFTADGQLWGNPLYRWDEMKKDDYAWWIRRLAAAGRLYDVVRMDHFRGLESYWSVPYGDPTARNGRWVKGPGMSFINAVKKHLPQLEMIAEDLGYLTQEVLDLRDASGYPGMKVLEFAFDSREDSDYLPHNYPKNCVVYTGTHDNSTVMGWFNSAKAEDMALAVDYLKLTEEEGYNWGMMRGAWSSVGNLAVVQMQDVLGLGDEARMNTPSTVGANWQWRMERGAATEELAARLRHQMELYHRI